MLDITEIGYNTPTVHQHRNHTASKINKNTPFSTISALTRTELIISQCKQTVRYQTGLKSEIHASMFVLKPNTEESIENMTNTKDNT